MIYFALLSTGAIQIGFATDVAARIRQLEEDYDEPVKLLAVMEGDKETKAWLYREFANLRFGTTEQFRPGSALLEFIGYKDQLWDDDGYDWCEPLPDRKPLRSRRSRPTDRWNHT